LNDRAASPPAWPCENHGQACRSGECTVAAEAVMNNLGKVDGLARFPTVSLDPETFNYTNLAACFKLIEGVGS
jgi:hypothetical protein